MEPLPSPLTDREKIDNLTIALNNVTKLVLAQQGIHAALEGALISVRATHTNPILLAADMMERMGRARAVLQGGSSSELTSDGFQATARNLVAACRLAIATPPVPSDGMPPSPETPSLH